MDIEKIVQSNLDKHKEDVTQEVAQEGEIESVNSQNTEISIAPKPQEKAVGFTDTITSITQAFVPDTTKSVNEQAKEAVDVLSVAEAVKDRVTVADLTKHKKDELISRAEANAKEEKAKSKISEITLQKAEFGVYEGIASYAGIKKSLPKDMQKILMVPLQVVVGVLLFIFGTLAAGIIIVIDAINSIMLRFSELTESSRKAIKNIGKFAGIAMGLIALYLGIRAVLQRYGVWFNI